MTLIQELTENAVKKYTQTLLNPKAHPNISLYSIIHSAIQVGMADAFDRGYKMGQPAEGN